MAHGPEIGESNYVAISRNGRGRLGSRAWANEAIRRIEADENRSDSDACREPGSCRYAYEFQGVPALHPQPYLGSRSVSSPLRLFVRSDRRVMGL